MSGGVSAEILRATILAGTVAAPSAGASDLPPAAFGTPEPGWAERDLAAQAPKAGTPQRSLAMEAAAGPLHGLGLGGLLAAYASGTADPPAVLDALRARMKTHRSGGDAVLAYLPEAEAMARDSAARIRAGTARALEGVPFGVKDIIDAAGAPVTCGSFQTGDRVAATDATIVARLRAQGAIPVAMLATTEFACGSAHNPRYGAVGNPWDNTRWTGGSSTGSGAALAARLLPLALGSDTGGSIRVPAAFCGITGLKPTRGLVPRTGVAPLSWTLDHVGPMARSAADLARVMPLIAGPDGQDPMAAGHYAGDRWRDDLSGLRIGVPGGWFRELLDDAVLDAWQGALTTFEAAGARLVPVDLGDVGSAHIDGYLIMMCELASLQEPDFHRMEAYDPGMRARIEQGLRFAATDYLRALRRRPQVMQRIAQAMAEVDVLITPGVGGEAARLAELTIDVNGTPHPLQAVLAHNTMLFDYTGLPALMLPSGLGRSGLPIAIQIVGKPYDDALCLSLGSAFQRLTDFHMAAPPEQAAVAG
jgi:aspartyl-tRNA(Asn)/glutamyl-tRNA(Gln) amidotransferase subunit A